MGRIISIANQKGGVGKTTTTINLSASLAMLGKKVLTIDMDPQGNATSGMGIDKNNLENTVYNMLLGECAYEDILCETCVDNLKMLPANINLSGAEVELILFEEREYRLKKVLDLQKDKFDFIIIDCPPSLNVLTLNALTASDTVLVPIQCEYFALEGLTQLLHTIGLVKEKLNPTLAVEGVAFTMYDSRVNISMQVVDEVNEHLEKDTYKAIIPRNVRLSEAPSHGLPITVYDPKSKGAEGYMNLAKSVAKKERGRWQQRKD